MLYSIFKNFHAKASKDKRITTSIYFLSFISGLVLLCSRFFCTDQAIPLEDVQYEENEVDEVDGKTDEAESANDIREYVHEVG